MTGFKFATLLRVVVLTLLFFSAAQPSTFAVEKSFTFINMSGKTFSNVFISLQGFWGNPPELAPRVTLRHGQRCKISYDDSQQRYWDITAELKDGSSWTWAAVELQNISEMIDRKSVV